MNDTPNPSPDSGADGSSRREVVRRWAGLILGTLVLIGCALLAGKAIERVVAPQVRYEQTVVLDIRELYGTWRYAETAHRWYGSELTPEALDEQMRGTVYVITEELFFAAGGQNWSVERPSYVLHPLEEADSPLDDVSSWVDEPILGYYAVLSSGGTVQPYRIYVSRENCYLAKYTDQTEGRRVALYDLFRLEKAE